MCRREGQPKSRNKSVQSVSDQGSQHSSDNNSQVNPSEAKRKKAKWMDEENTKMFNFLKKSNNKNKNNKGYKGL